jgi:hypothetical protein
MTITFRINDLADNTKYTNDYTVDGINKLFDVLAKKTRSYIKVWITVLVDGKEFFTPQRMAIFSQNKDITKIMQSRCDFYRSERGINYAMSMRQYFDDAGTAEEYAQTYSEIAELCRKQQEEKKMHTFKVGQTYIMTFVTDSNLKVPWTVIKRTPKMLTITDNQGKTVRKKIKVYGDSEYVEPYGKFSMSPWLRAKNIKSETTSLKLVQAQPVKTEEEELEANWLRLCGE